MSITYQTLGDGTVQELDASGQWVTRMPSAAEMALFDKQTTQWFGLVSDAVARYGLPPVLVFAILAIIYSESNGGVADIGPSFDGGVGLMAITAPGLKKKPGGGVYSSNELKDPYLNVDIGVGKVIAPDYAQVGLDLPQLASMFNAGSPGHGAWPSSSAPWGWREYKIPSTGAYPYISKVVRMNNYAIQSLAGQTPVSPDQGGPPMQAGLAPWLAALSLALLSVSIYRRYNA